MGFSLYFLCKNYRIMGSHILRWELLALGSVVLLLMCAFLGSPSAQNTVPFLQPNSMSFAQLAFLFASLVGIIAGLGGIKSEKRKRKLMTPKQGNQDSSPIAKIEGTL